MPDDTDLAEVRLLRIPLRLRARSAQHGEELMRELALIQIGAQQHAREHVEESVPQRLLDLAAEAQTTYGAFSAAPDAEMAAALERGEEDLDVTYRVPRHVGPFVRRMRGILEEADEYCRQGEHLLTLAAPADVAAYRRWLFDQFERQIAGEDPQPWRGAE
ncbi:hypothetical protein CLV92_11542 [Kineococcus xinjiangensis]|uniref:Uncharacterized protein n=1 Tax=Kineococcus xinjiangensis TaxID=512762 RepID=A0A2S6IDN5_9ACTN|nr:hypothetical protein [Kineococcus xinjiangensis]PPK92296.1 hypothetical protein CLV92_11542 [Kineococcus xinjiangensis]